MTKILVSLAALTFSALAHAAAPGSSYYDQFLYKAEGDCKDIENVYFRSTNAWNAAELGVDAKGRKVRALLAIQFFQGGKYYAQYEEKAVVYEDENSITYEILFTKALTGQWSVEGDQIQVLGLGVGSPGKVTYPAEANGIQFQMTTALNDQRVLKTPMAIGRSLTTTGPNGVSVEDYCGQH